MVSTARVRRAGRGWAAVVRLGSISEFYGPYRWRWVARYVAWLNDGIH